MFEFNFILPILIVSLLALGLVAVVSTRLLRSGWKRHLSFVLFFTWMSVTGVTCALLAGFGSELWLPLGAMLALLAVGATLDLGSEELQNGV